MIWRDVGEAMMTAMLRQAFWDSLIMDNPTIDRDTLAAVVRQFAPR